MKILTCKTCLVLLALTCIGMVSLMAQSVQMNSLPSRAELIATMTSAQHNPNYYISVAHRAKVSGYEISPENSLSSIKNCVELGVEVLEIDLKISKDDSIYLMHDNYLQRTTNFTNVYTGIGTGSDSYGSCDNYNWHDTKTLLLKRSDFTYSNERIPLFRDVLKYARDSSRVILNLDINDDAVFRHTWNIVKSEGAFDVVIFKTRGATLASFLTEYYNALTDSERSKLMLFPIISAKIADIPAYYAQWENSGIPKGYEVSYRDNKSTSDTTLLRVVSNIRATNRVRIHVFSTLPDNYMGRYIGNVNINQCCNSAYDRRGDWEFLLDPHSDGNMNNGVNGSIITDDPITLDGFLSSVGRKNIAN